MDDESANRSCLVRFDKRFSPSDSNFFIDDLDDADLALARRFLSLSSTQNCCLWASCFHVLLRPTRNFLSFLSFFLLLDFDFLLRTWRSGDELTLLHELDNDEESEVDDESDSSLDDKDGERLLFLDER